MSRVVIIGAGLAGSLLAIYLAKRGIGVTVFEARGDMRLQEVDAGRSINLALSDRGIAALREVGMGEYARGPGSTSRGQFDLSRAAAVLTGRAG
jgi:kynurenine 3-monooxygenase